MTCLSEGRWRVVAIVPAMNAGATMADCLEALLCGGDLSPSDVMVVDNGSTDDTEYQAALRGVGIMHCAVRGPAAARNAGLRNVREGGADYILFVDADAVLDKGWLAEACQFLAGHPTYAGVGGLARSFGSGLAERALDASLWGIAATESHICDVSSLATMNVLYRSAAVADLLFDDRLIAGEDPDFAFALRDQGWLLATNPSMTLRHHNPTTVRGIWRKWYLYGRYYPAPYLLHPRQISFGFIIRMMGLPSALVAITAVLASRGVAAAVLFFVLLVTGLSISLGFGIARGAEGGVRETALLVAVHVGKFLAHQAGIWRGVVGFWGLSRRRIDSSSTCA